MDSEHVLSMGKAVGLVMIPSGFFWTFLDWFVSLFLSMGALGFGVSYFVTSTMKYAVFPRGATRHANEALNITTRNRYHYHTCHSDITHIWRRTKCKDFSAYIEVGKYLIENRKSSNRLTVPCRGGSHR